MAFAARSLALSPLAAPTPSSDLDVAITAACLLPTGGDNRLTIDATTSANRYGCGVLPDPGAAAFGSSTASVISAPAFAAAEALAGRLAGVEGRAPRAVTYALEIDRLRRELVALCALETLPGLKTVMAPSGTDLHRIVMGMIASDAQIPPLAVVCEPTETGSGVGAALGGQFTPASALRAQARFAGADASRSVCQIMMAPARGPDGALRPSEQVDEEVATAVGGAAGLGRRVLLILMDVSKTGLISPSIDCALTLKRRFPETVDVLVDACQLRLSSATLRAYLERGLMVAVTGSKFMTGPTFSAALFVPEDVAARFNGCTLPASLSAVSARADWPEDWMGVAALPSGQNFGLLLRWQAALEEMRRFNALPPERVAAFFDDFALAVTDHLAANPALEAVAERPLDRSALGAAKAWDATPTIFSFLLTARGRALTPLETLGVHRLMTVDLGGWAARSLAGAKAQADAGLRAQLGQPVACGTRNDAPLSALRLCASARLAVDALSRKGPGPAAVINQARAVLDKAAWLAARVSVEG